MYYIHKFIAVINLLQFKYNEARNNAPRENALLHLAEVTNLIFLVSGRIRMRRCLTRFC